eukprot:3455408-Rhodomonas_salina.5
MSGTDIAHGQVKIKWVGQLRTLIKSRIEDLGIALPPPYAMSGTETAQDLYRPTPYPVLIQRIAVPCSVLTYRMVTRIMLREVRYWRSVCFRCLLCEVRY